MLLATTEYKDNILSILGLFAFLLAYFTMYRSS